MIREFLESKGISRNRNIDVKDNFGKFVKRLRLADLLEEYHQAKLKSDLLHSVSYCSCDNRSDNWYDDFGNHCFDCDKIIKDSCS